MEALRRTVVRDHVAVVVRNTGQFNVTGHPALTVPCADSGALPVGLMLVGRHFDDDVILRIGRAYEIATSSSVGGVAI